MSSQTELDVVTGLKVKSKRTLISLRHQCLLEVPLLTDVLQRLPGIGEVQADVMSFLCPAGRPLMSKTPGRSCTTKSGDARKRGKWRSVRKRGMTAVCLAWRASLITTTTGKLLLFGPVCVCLFVVLTWISGVLQMCMSLSSGRILCVHQLQQQHLLVPEDHQRDAQHTVLWVFHRLPGVLWPQQWPLPGGWTSAFVHSELVHLCFLCKTHTPHYDV